MEESFSYCCDVMSVAQVIKHGFLFTSGTEMEDGEEKRGEPRTRTMQLMGIHWRGALFIYFSSCIALVSNTVTLAQGHVWQSVVMIANSY